MEKILNGIWKFFLYLWQFPQNIAGWLYLFFVFKRVKKIQPYHDVCVFVLPDFKGGLSLGKYVFVEALDWHLVCHEYGHSRQSKFLGWLYLVLIGLPSVLWYSFYRDSWRVSYYWFYTEKWADYLGGVKRKK